MRSLSDVIDRYHPGPGTFWLAIVALGVGMGAFLIWLDPEPSLETHDCLHYTTVIMPIPVTTSCGKNCMTTRITFIPVTSCDHYGPWYPNPAHAAWVIRQQEKENRKK